MWALIVSLCMSIGGAPACISEIHPEAMRTFAACEDAAVITHDDIRGAAEADNIDVLSLDTRCFTTAGLLVLKEDDE
jgi:hypothetical protein